MVCHFYPMKWCTTSRSDHGRKPHVHDVKGKVLGNESNQTGQRKSIDSAWTSNAITTARVRSSSRRKRNVTICCLSHRLQNQVCPSESFCFFSSKGGADGGRNEYINRVYSTSKLILGISRITPAPSWQTTFLLLYQSICFCNLVHKDEVYFGKWGNLRLGRSNVKTTASSTLMYLFVNWHLIDAAPGVCHVLCPVDQC